MSKILNIEAKDYDQAWLQLEPSAAEVFIRGGYTHVRFEGYIYQCIVEYAPLMPKRDENKVVYISAEQAV